MTKLLVILIVVLGTLYPVIAEDARCPQVRVMVAQYGAAQSIAWARTQGYSNDQIQQARACMVRRRVDKVKQN